MTEEKKEMTEEKERIEKIKYQYKLEHKKFLEWRSAVLLIDRDEILNLLVFKLNDNLEKIVDLLDRIVDHFDLGG
jgi:hypothetical protein